MTTTSAEHRKCACNHVVRVVLELLSLKEVVIVHNKPGKVEKSAGELSFDFTIQYYVQPPPDHGPRRRKVSGTIVLRKDPKTGLLRASTKQQMLKFGGKVYTFRRVDADSAEAFVVYRRNVRLVVGTSGSCYTCSVTPMVC